VGVPVVVALLGVSAGVMWMARTPEPPPVAARLEPARQQQLQFSLPGGTRIIWFFNSDLEVK
jgi:hypothetical protein